MGTKGATPPSSKTPLVFAARDRGMAATDRALPRLSLSDHAATDDVHDNWHSEERPDDDDECTRSVCKRASAFHQR